MLGGIEVEVQTQAQNNTFQLYGSNTKKEKCHALNERDLLKLKENCIAKGVLQIEATDMDQTASIEDIYNFTQIIDIIQRHLKDYNCWK